jgi:hypothetical protein
VLARLGSAAANSDAPRDLERSMVGTSGAYIDTSLLFDSKEIENRCFAKVGKRS